MYISRGGSKFLFECRKYSIRFNYTFTRVSYYKTKVIVFTMGMSYGHDATFLSVRTETTKVQNP
jgi:hypothetical protein